MLVLRQFLRKVRPIKSSKAALANPAARIRYSDTVDHSFMWHQQSFGFVNIQITSKYYHEQLPIKINDILEMIEKQKVLNQKTALLEHLTDIVTSNPAIILNKDQRAKIVKQIKLWGGGRGRFDKVATVAWVIVRLNLLKELKPLYQEIVSRFEEDEWYVNFDESLKALEAFTHLQDQSVKNFIYPRIERNLQITVWEQNMKVYKRMVMGLLQSGRLDSELWDKLQDLILKNLGMEYSLTTITDIFTCYAIARKGSDKFFQMLQKTIYLGHWYDYDFKHKILPGYDQTGQFYALLVQTYSIVRRNCNIHLLPEFLEYIYKGVADRQTNYQHLSSFTKIIEHLPGLFEEEDEEDIITNLLELKKPTSLGYSEIIEFYNALALRGISLPKKLHRHIESVLLSDIRKKLIPASNVIEICEQLLENGYVLNQPQLLDAVEESLTSGFRYLESQQAKAVLQLSKVSKFLSNKTKEQLTLPGKVSGKP